MSASGTKSFLSCSRSRSASTTESPESSTRRRHCIRGLNRADTPHERVKDATGMLAVYAGDVSARLRQNEFAVKAWENRRSGLAEDGIQTSVISTAKATAPKI